MTAGTADHDHLVTRHKLRRRADPHGQSMSRGSVAVDRSRPETEAAMTRVSWATLQPGETEHVLSVMLCQGRNAVRVRPSRGDGGIDAIEVTPAGWVVDQIKYFATNLTDSQKAQVEKSFKRLSAYAAAQGATVAAWNLWLPLDPTNENRTWFEGFTRDAGFPCRWRGLTDVEGLAARYPEVIDYYLGNGKERLQNIVTQLIGAMNLRRQATADAEVLRPSDIETDLGNLHAALNAHDPHYRYDFAVDGERPPASPPEPLLVAEVLRRHGGAWVTFKVYARMRVEEAARERPAPFDVQVQAPAGTDAAQALDDFGTFGLPVSIRGQDGVVVSGSVDLPGGLGTAFTGGVLHLGPVWSDGAEPYDLRMQILDPDGTELVTVRLKMEPVTTGPTGEGVRAFGTEEHGVFTLEIRLNAAKQEGDMTIRTMDVTGLRPVEALPGLRAADAFHAPNQVRFAAPYGTVNHAGQPLPEAADLDLGHVVAVVDALSVIQDHTTQQISIPGPAQLSRQARDLLRTAQLLRDGSLAATWSHLTEPVPAGTIDPQADLGTPSALVYVKPLVVTIGDEQVRLGYRRASLASVRVESITPSPDGQNLLLTFVPGDDNSALIEFIPAPE
jgi:hypothetical protein